ncbi:translin-associated protein X isoform X1 [Hydra vulgaris]|nr:translin-associated protein X [Hydra vulgaris]
MDENDELQNLFLWVRDRLDSRNDKREKILKFSRDITNESKKVIFSLLRKGIPTEMLLSEAEIKLQFLKKLLSYISEELKEEDAYMFHKSFSFGVQEFIEAVSLYFFIKNETLIEFDNVCNQYFIFHGSKSFLFPQDYLGGIADLTGELMRVAVNSLGVDDNLNITKICEFARLVYKQFSVFVSLDPELFRKVCVMKSSLIKIENTIYILKVRGAELSENFTPTSFQFEMECPENDI